MSGSCVRLFGLALLGALGAVSSLGAQDYFEQKKRELAVVAQQTVAEVTGVLEKSRQLEKTNASQAKALLEKSLLTVNDSNALDEKQRADLRGRLLARLKEVSATAREQKVVGDSVGKSAVDKAERNEKERQAVEKMQGQQKSVFDSSKDRIDYNKKTIDAQNQIRNAKEKGVTSIAMEVSKAASKVNEERITAYFIEKSDKRKASKLSKEEVNLLKALNSTISVDYNKMTFKEVMNDISERAKINIFPDVASLKEAGVFKDSGEYDAQVSFKANKVTVRTVLKRVLADLGLTYVVVEGNIQVITPDKAKDFVVTRAYPIGDLITPFGNNRFGPAVNRAQMLQQAQELMQLIMNTIEPGSWAGTSERGFGTISFSEATMTLVIRHTAEMHYMLGGGLGR